MKLNYLYEEGPGDPEGQPGTEGDEQSDDVSEEPFYPEEEEEGMPEAEPYIRRGHEIYPSIDPTDPWPTPKRNYL